MIDKMQVSFLLSFSNSTSNVQFGEYDASAIKVGEETEGYGMHWYELTGTQHWQIEITDLILNGESFFSGITSRAILDTGTSFITVPTSDFHQIINHFSSRHPTTFGCQPDQTVCFFVGN